MSRRKLYPTPGKNPRAAWKWLYDVAIPGQEDVMTGEGLSWALGTCKRLAPGMPVRLSWVAP